VLAALLFVVVGEEAGAESAKDGAGNSNGPAGGKSCSWGDRQYFEVHACHSTNLEEVGNGVWPAW